MPGRSWRHPATVAWNCGRILHSERQAADDLGLTEGSEVTAVIKASDVILAVAD